MDEFLNDEQLKRLFDRNLPKQPLPPDMAERLLRRVNAEVRATYSPQQRPQSLARQLAQRRAPTQSPPLPLTTPVAKSSGRSWIFSSSPSTWLTFVGTVAAAVVFAVIFSRTSLLNPIKIMVLSSQTATSVAAALPSNPSSSPSDTQDTPTPVSGSGIVENSETPTPETPNEPAVSSGETTESNNTATETQTEATNAPTPIATSEPAGGGGSTTATRTSTPTRSSIAGVPSGPTKATATSTPTPSKKGSTPTGGRTPTPTYTIGQGTKAASNATRTSTPTPRSTRSSNGSGGTTPLPTSDQASVAEQEDNETPNPQSTPTRTRSNSSMATATPTVRIVSVNSTATSTRTPTPTKAFHFEPRGTVTPTRSVSNPLKLEPTKTPTATRTPTRIATAPTTSAPVVPATATRTPTRIATAPTTSAPVVPATATRTPTRIATAPTTSVPVVPATATPIPTRTPTRTPTYTATATDVPTDSPTRTPTRTTVPAVVSTPTPTDTPVPTATYTRKPTSIPTETQTATRTATPEPTDTKTATPEPTDTKTATPEPTDTKTATPEPTDTKTATPEPTDTKTATATDTPTNTATVTPTPTSTNSPPTINTLVLQLEEDTDASGDVLSVVHDVDGDPMELVSITQPTNGTATKFGNRVSYTPNPNFNGSDSFSFVVSVGNQQYTGSVLVTVSPVNDAPIARSIDVNMPQDSSLTLYPLSVASDVDNNKLSLSWVGSPAHGSAQQFGDNIVYTPNLGFVGTDRITFRVADETEQAESTIDVTVLAVNHAPTANDIVVVIKEGTVATVNVSQYVGDSDGDALRIISTEGPANGIATFDDTTITYTPNPSFSGIDAVPYTISDGQKTATAKVQITVLQNHPPTGRVDDINVDEDASTGVSFDPLKGLSDPDGDSISVINTSLTAPEHGTVAWNDSQLVYYPSLNFNGLDKIKYQVTDGKLTIDVEVNVMVAPQNDAPIADPTPVSLNQDTSRTIDVSSLVHDIDGDPLSIGIAAPSMHGQLTLDGFTFTYIPEANYSGEDSFTYSVSDGLATATALVTISVEPVATPTPTDTPTDTPTATTAAVVVTQEVTPVDTAEPLPTDIASPTSVEGEGGTGG